MKAILLTLALALLPAAAAGDDASLDVLEPGPAFGTTNSEYDGIVRTVFPEAFLPDVRASMLMVPVMRLVHTSPTGEEIADGETVIGVKERDGEFFVFAAESHAGFWDYTAEGQRAAAQYDTPLRPVTLADIRPKRCERPIDPALAARIVQIWQTMLLQTRPDPNAHHGFDGETYYFSMPVDGRTLAGRTWSPNSPRLGGLTTVADDMESWCMRDLHRRLADLRTDVAGLEALLKALVAP